MRLPADASGRASERTALAWQRTGLVLTTLGVLALTTSLHRGTPEVGAPVAAILAGLGWTVARRGREAYRARRRDERYRADERGVVLVAAVTVAAACLAAAVIVVGW